MRRRERRRLERQRKRKKCDLTPDDLALNQYLFVRPPWRYIGSINAQSSCGACCKYIGCDSSGLYNYNQFQMCNNNLDFFHITTYGNSAISSMIVFISRLLG